MQKTGYPILSLDGHKMRILFFYQYFGTPKGSWSTRVYELTRRWVEEGHELVVVTAPYEKSDVKPNGFISSQTIDGIKLIIVNSGDSNRLSLMQRAFRAVRFALVSAYYALTQPCDIVIASSGPITIGIPMILAKLLRRKKTVFEVRDLWPAGAIEMGLLKYSWQKNIALSFEALCYKKADLVVPCSTGMDASIRGRFPESRTLVIPNGSDLDLFNIVPTRPDVFPAEIGENHIFLYAGSLGLMDDCGQVVNAMTKLKNEAISLVFIGDGAERKALEKQAEKTGNSNIHFMGLLPKTEVVKWFSLAVASFVTFKNYDVLDTSSPNKMFDSFAAGVPIIQSTKGWIKDLISEEECGINVSSDESTTFDEAVKLLALDFNLQKKMSANASRVGKTRFSRDVLASRYIETLKELR